MVAKGNSKCYFFKHDIVLEDSCLCLCYLSICKWLRWCYFKLGVRTTVSNHELWSREHKHRGLNSMPYVRPKAQRWKTEEARNMKKRGLLIKRNVSLSSKADICWNVKGCPSVLVKMQLLYNGKLLEINLTYLLFCSSLFSYLI